MLNIHKLPSLMFLLYERDGVIRLKNK